VTMVAPLIPSGLLANGVVPANPRDLGRIYVRLPGDDAPRELTLRQALQLQRDLQNAINLAAGWQV